MHRSARILATVLFLRALPVAAQPVDASARAPDSYTRPVREDGTLLVAPTPRVVPASERALSGVNGSRVETVGPPRWGLGALAGVLVAGLGLALTLQLTRQRSVARSSSRPPAAHPGIEVRMVTIAIDWNLRASIEHSLSQVRARSEPAGPQALHAVASAVRDSLARVHASMRAAAFQSWSLDLARAQTTFAQTATALRARGRPEALAAVRPPGAPPAGHATGLAVVTVIVSTRCPLPPLPPQVDTASLLAVLDALVPPRRDMLAGLDVVWAPEAQSVALAPAEAGALFPELVGI